MRSRLLALALLGAAIAALILLYRHHQNRPRPAVTPLTTLAPATLTRIVMKAQGEPPLVLTRNPAGWYMQKPIRVRADTNRIDALLSGLGEATTRHYPERVFSLAKIGLSPPEFTLEVGGTRLEFGALNPANMLRYVRRGDTVYLVFDAIAPQLAGGPWQFVERRLLPRGAQITRIVSDIPGAAGITGHAQAWLSARAKQVKPLASGAAKSAPTIEISLAGRHRPIVFVLLARRPQLELARPAAGIVYLLDAALADKLLAPSAATAKASAGTAGSRDHTPRP